jgi:hypothetical protein
MLTKLLPKNIDRCKVDIWISVKNEGIWDIGIKIC